MFRCHAWRLTTAIINHHGLLEFRNHWDKAKGPHGPRSACWIMWLVRGGFGGISTSGRLLFENLRRPGLNTHLKRLLNINPRVKRRCGKAMVSLGK